MGGYSYRAAERLRAAHEGQFDRRHVSHPPPSGPFLHPANSPRAGNKKDNINIVYTPWSNLKKDGSMATGQVGFKDQRKVKRVLVDTRINAIINRLDKTRVETFPDLYAEKEERLKLVRAREKKMALKRVGTQCDMCAACWVGADGNVLRRRRKRPGSRRRGGSSRGRGIMPTTRCSPRMRWRRTRTRAAGLTTLMTLCDRSHGMKIRVVSLSCCGCQEKWYREIVY